MERRFKKNSVANRASLQISNLLLIFIFLLMAFLCFFYTNQLSDTETDRIILAGLSGFWVLRIITQFIFLAYNKTALHILTAAFIIGDVLFALPVLMK